MPPAEPSENGRGRLLAPLIFGLLVVATLGAFAYAQKRKGEPLVLDRVVFGYPNEPARKNAFTPNGDGCVDRGRIKFRITSADRGDIQIVTPDEVLVRVLAADRELPSYDPLVLFWDGRDRSGRLAPPGRYKLRVLLSEQDKALVPRGRLRLHDVPPRPECDGKGGGGG